jgi:hypothetical protein
MKTRGFQLSIVVVLGLFIFGFLILIAPEDSYAAPKLKITKAKWNSKKAILKVAGRGWGSGTLVTISNRAVGTTLGTVQANSKGAWKVTVTDPPNVPCWVWADATTGSAEKAVKGSPIVCTSPPSSPSVKVFSFNNLGMHCYDSDFSVFSILPPFNTVNAQVVRRGASATNPVILDNAQATVSFRAVVDASGSINTTSANKTNFWDNVLALFGVSLPVDVGLAGVKMPGTGNTPQPFTTYYTPAMKWFTAEGIPITILDDSNNRNPYPLMAIVALDVLTSNLPSATSTVLPVSDEMYCSNCHSTGGVAANTTAQTKYGIAAWSTSVVTQIQYRENILILHDAKHATGMMAVKPVLCASCHYSPALDLAGTGPSGNQVGKPMFSFAVHGRHGKDINGGIPSATSPAIIPGVDVAACYNCHPGTVTKCLRGAMGAAGITCNDCHGGLLAVGGVYPTTPARTPWVNEPRCESCHTGDALVQMGNQIRLRVAYDPADPSASPRIATNKRFAEEPNTLYRNSLGHGGMACQACHGSTHAEWPNADPKANDNVAAIQLQGYTGPIIECSVCHGDGQALTTNGPHGLHNVNSRAWNDGHKDFFRLGASTCQTCHGVALEGTVLSRASTNRSLVLEEGGTKFIAKGTQVSCTLCHENPLTGGAQRQRFLRKLY